MLKKNLLTLIISLLNTFSYSQNSITGEYYLHGVSEMASGFLLKPDSTFQFFFSYGALDREGSGKYSIHNNNIVFSSRPKPSSDFGLIQTKIVDNDSIIIKIVDSNTILIRYVYALLKFTDTTIEEKTNDDGQIIIPGKGLQSISLQLEFCPDKNSIFKIEKNNNYFEFRMEPFITEVFFENFQLSIGKNELRGKHPLLDDKEYTFVKEK